VVYIKIPRTLNRNKTEQIRMADIEFRCALVCNYFKKLAGIFSVLLLFPALVLSQTTPIDGIKDNTPSVHAFTNVTVVVSPGNTLQDATLVIRDGIIESVGEGNAVPSDARVWDMTGKTIYAGFIDPHSDVGHADPRVELELGSQSWNPNLRAHLSSTSEYDVEDDGSGELRSQGFTTALSVPPLGIFRGSTSVVSLSEGLVAQRIVKDNVTQAANIDRSWDFGFTYPTSSIGVIALIRQTLYDADWHKRAHETYEANPSGLERPEMNQVLLALNNVIEGDQSLIFETDSDEEILRALRLRDEFDIPIWIRGNGHEYKLLDVLENEDVPYILPLSYPEKPDIDSPEDALDEDFAELRHYYLAPENPMRMSESGITYSITSDGLEEKTDFLKNLRLAVDAGLSPEDALAALTVNPANLLGIEATHGSLEAGKAANLIVTDGDLFTENAHILDVWVDGDRFEITPEESVNPRGEWEITTVEGILNGTLTIEESRPGRFGGTYSDGSSEADLSSVSVDDAGSRIRVDFKGDSLNVDGLIRLTASITENGEALEGWADIPGSDAIQWTGSRLTTVEKEHDISREAVERDVILTDIRPAMEFGRESLPEQPETVLVRNATIWTMEDEGVLENADLLIRDGKVEEVGMDLSAPRNSVIIDAEGKHVTPGLIDAHIHSGVDGVNEIGNAVTAEVRLGDVLNINNIWMYRQLAGGLTSAHVMHGSANPIGGQNEHIKMRWGALSDDLKIEGAPRTVKFALGENPKRVGTDRYPETRMGTEQIIEDRFNMARDYEARWQRWEETGEGIPPRRDLRLDALLGIINGDIIIQSHSYRQDEILTLMRLAERFDFKIGAFHHGVEAYKVAPELAEHGAGAVVWSDWSSFKIEAYDGTLYNAKLLTEAGVLTSLHSDNSQISSRMNWEAAKMLKAGMQPEEALALVTINTAKVLGIDDMVGSLAPGKDADFVIWNGDPLSTFTKAEQTWIDGRKYFDLDKDTEMRAKLKSERTDLIEWVVENGYE
jgi:imidazolonepropionase-like amidohydrolase